MLTVFVVSDATGKTVEQLVRAALAQFQDAPAHVVRRGNVTSKAKLSSVVREAAKHKGLIFHTLLSAGLRRHMLAEGRKAGVDSADLLGPVLERLALRMNLQPGNTPGFFKQLEEIKSRKIGAVDFAFRHDDGQHAEDIGEADIVLVGISRTMKTPVTLYLAYQGWYAANIPLIPEIPPPKELLTLPSGRIFCLAMDADRLLELRRSRTRHSHFPEETYAAHSAVERESAYSMRLARRHRWRQIDVSGKSVEEVAREIVTLL